MGMDTLGSTVHSYLSGREKEFRQKARIADAWGKLLPAKLHDSCRIVDIGEGVVKVAAEAGPVMHQLVLLKPDLKDKLQNRCGVNAVRDIVVIPQALDKDKYAERS